MIENLHDKPVMRQGRHGPRGELQNGLMPGVAFLDAH